MKSQHMELESAFPILLEVALWSKWGDNLMLSVSQSGDLGCEENLRPDGIAERWWEQHWERDPGFSTRESVLQSRARRLPRIELGGEASCLPLWKPPRTPVPRKEQALCEGNSFSVISTGSCYVLPSTVKKRGHQTLWVSVEWELVVCSSST